MASDTAELEAACPTCGATVTTSVTLALAPIIVDGKQTSVPTCGLRGDAHWCPVENVPAVEAAVAAPTADDGPE